MRINLLMEKWCDLNPELGCTSAHANVIGSLESAQIPTTIFHYDEFLRTNGYPIDELLIQHTLETRPDMLFVSYYPFHDSRNVANETFRKIRDNGVPVVFIWFDFGHKHIRNLALEMSQHNTLNVIVDVYDEPNYSFMAMWVPQDERIFSYSEQKNIEASFVGSRSGYSERNHFLTPVVHKVSISGGQREHRLTIEEYADLLKRSKVTLNFPSKPDGTIQAKSRIYESMLCGAMLLERENEAIKRWFEPYKHYIPFYNEQDLSDKIDYYLSHSEERMEIVRNAHEKMKNDYSARKWWERVAERANSKVSF